MIHLCCLRSKSVKFTASCWDHRSMPHRVSSSSVGDASNRCCSVAGISMLFDILWDHSLCYHWLGINAVGLKRSNDHASTRCPNADVDVRPTSLTELMAKADGWISSSSELFQLLLKNDVATQIQMLPSLKTASHRCWLEPLWLSDRPCTCCLLLLPSHQQVFGNRTKLLYIFGAVDLSGKFFDFKLLAQSQSNWFHKSFWLGKQKLPQKFLNSKSQT